MVMNAEAGGSYMGNTVEGNQGPGVTVSGGGAPTLEGNQIKNNTGAGVMCWGDSCPQLTANALEHNGESGLVVGERVTATVEQVRPLKRASLLWISSNQRLLPHTVPRVGRTRIRPSDPFEPQGRVHTTPALTTAVCPCPVQYRVAKRNELTVARGFVAELDVSQRRQRVRVW
jgi:parallel beta-helix repeat protein